MDGCLDECVTDPDAPLASNPAPGIVATLTEGPLLCEAGCPWKFTTDTAFTTAVDDGDPAVEYRRGWHRRSDEAASGGGYHRRLGSPGGGGGQAPTARLVFEGEEITYFFARSEQGGTADVFLDGAFETTVDYSGQAPGSSPELGHSITFDGLGEGSHEILIEHLTGAAYVDGFEIVTTVGGGADPSAALTRSITTVSSAELPGLGSAVVAEAVEVGPGEEWLSVVVEGAAAPVTVHLRDPTLTLVAEAGQLVAGAEAVGFDVEPALVGTYTVQVVDALGSPATVEISIVRTIALE